MEQILLYRPVFHCCHYDSKILQGLWNTVFVLVLISTYELLSKHKVKVAGCWQRIFAAC